MTGDVSRMVAGRRWRRQTGAVSMLWLVAFGLVGGVLLYWSTTPQDAPPWVREHLPGLSTGTLYRWHDDQGREQVTDKPPKGRPFEPVVYPTNVNVMPAANRRESP